MRDKIKHDVELVNRAVSGDRKALREIVEIHKKQILYLAFDLTCSMEDAEDLSQEVFLKLTKSLNKYGGNALLSSWLYRITINTYLTQKNRGANTLRQNTVDAGVSKSIDTFPLPNDNITDPEKYAEEEQKQFRLNSALKTLSKRERTVFVLRNYQGMKIKTCSEYLKISVGTVKTLQFRAVKKLHKKLNQVFAGEYK